MFGNMDFSNLGEMFSEVQKKSQQMQQEADAKIHEAKSGGGMVRVKANGKGELVDIEIDDSLMDDKDSLQILLISAINEVHKNVEEGKKEAAMSMFGDMSQFMNKKE